MISEHLVDISRLQFAVTALYHFFVRTIDLRYGMATRHYGIDVCDDG